MMIYVFAISVCLMLLVYALDIVFLDESKAHLDMGEESVSSKIYSSLITKSHDFQAGLLLLFVLSFVVAVVSACELWGIAYALLVVFAIMLVIVGISALFEKIEENEFFGRLSVAIYWILFPFCKLFSTLLLLFRNNVSINRNYEIEETAQSVDTKEVKEENEVEIFRNALDFSSLKIKNIMIPRTEIVALDVSASVEEFRQLFIETNYSRILIYKDNIDAIIGYAHSSDIFDCPAEISDVINPIVVVSEDMEASKLLHVLQKQRKSLALVVDEFGGTAGIITMEDMMEEIFGEIDDEYDDDEKLVMKMTRENEYVFSGRLEVDVVNEKMNLDLPQSADYETIAGLVLSTNNILPSKGEVVEVKHKFAFEIIKVSATRIDLVKMHLI